MNNVLPITVQGHVHIEDDLGNVHLDKYNAIHPQNMARVIARALSHESNSWINKIAFGNGGTVTNAAYEITYNAPNDGFPPDSAGWRSQLYNQTYYEYIDDSSLLISTGPGAVPANDPASIDNSPSGPGVVSIDKQLISQVVVTCYLNANEPTSQYLTDIVGTPVTIDILTGIPIPGTGIQEYTETPFTFDEIGLFTSGAPINATAGYHLANVNTRTSTDTTGLLPDTIYTFSIIVDNAIAPQVITFATPASGTGIATGGVGAITYNDIMSVINTQLIGAQVSINEGTVNTNGTPDLAGTYGYLQFISSTTGANSSIQIVTPPVIPINTSHNGVAVAPFWLFDSLSSFLGLLAPVQGQAAGFQNDVNHPTLEGERLLAHICFSPILKSANREFIIKYTLTVSVAKSS